MREVNEKHETPSAWKHERGKSARQKEVKKGEGNNVLLLPVIYLNLIVGDIVARFNSRSVFFFFRIQPPK